MDLIRTTKRTRIGCLVGLFLVFGLMAFTPSLAFSQDQEDYKILREIILNEFQDDAPRQHGGDFQDVVKRFSTDEKKVAVGLAACLDLGPAVDVPLMTKLAGRNIPYSVFADSAWLKQNRSALEPFVKKGSAQFENHGTFCRALSADGKVSGDYPKTTSLEEVFEEIEDNARLIEGFTGRLPRFYRVGYDYYDDLSLKVVSVLGYQAIQGDLKLRPQDIETPESMKLFLSQVQPGSIILIPANRPGVSQDWVDKLFDGLARAGYSIAALEDVAGIDLEDY